MKTERLIEDLQAIKDTNNKFFNEHEEFILSLLAMETNSAEEFLLQEILLELNDKLKRVNQLITYLKSSVKKDGTLSINPNGDIMLDGIKIPLMQEFEICLYQEETGKYIWTRTFILPFARDGQPGLAGVDKGLNIEGIRARLRFSIDQT